MTQFTGTSLANYEFEQFSNNFLSQQLYNTIVNLKQNFANPKDLELDWDCESNTRCKSIKINTRQYFGEIIFSWEMKKLLLATGFRRAVTLFRDIFRTLSKAWLKTINYFHKYHHHRYLEGFWICLGYFNTETTWLQMAHNSCKIVRWH